MGVCILLLKLLSTPSSLYSQISVNKCEKTFADITCFSLHAMSIFRNLLLLLLSVNLLSDFSAGSAKLRAEYLNVAQDSRLHVGNMG